MVEHSESSRNRRADRKPLVTTRRSESGTITPGDQNLVVKAASPEGIASIQIIANGNQVVAEKTCELGTKCTTLEKIFITETENWHPGILWLEVLVTETNELVSSERFWDDVPYVPPAANPKIEAPTFERISRFREEFGLDPDLHGVPHEERARDERIFNLIDAWHEPGTAAGQVAQASSERWGVPLRASDVAELEYREGYFAQDVALIDEWAREHASSTYGGHFMDERAGGILRVGFTERQEEMLAQMKEELGGALAATSRIAGFVTPPDRTVAQLESTEGALLEHWVSESGLTNNIIGVTFDPATNTIDVDAEELGKAESEVSLVLGSLSAVHFIAQNERPEFLSGRYRTAGPVKGGDFIRTATNGCTAGFGAVEQSPPGRAAKKFILTAGHCFPLGATVGRSDHFTFSEKDFSPIGTVVRNALPQVPRNSETDGLAIATNSEALSPTQIYTSRPIRAAAPAGVSFHEEYREGDRLCFSGLIDGLQCGISGGKVIQKFVGAEAQSGKMLAILVKGVEVEHGDSGAPVWNSRTSRPIGVVSGAINLGSPNGLIFVTPIRPLTTTAGVVQPGLLEGLSHQIGPLSLNLG